MVQARLVIEATALGVEEVLIKVPHGRREEGLRLLARSLDAIEQLDKGARTAVGRAAPIPRGRARSR